MPLSFLSRASLVAMAVVSLSACASKLAPIQTTELGNNNYRVVAQSEYSVSHAQKQTLKQAQQMCGAKKQDVLPDTELSQYQAGFGKVTYSLVFRCGKM